MILPSDHHIARPDAFRAALSAAAQASQNGDLLTLGIQPTRGDGLRLPAARRRKETRRVRRRRVRRKTRRRDGAAVPPGPGLFLERGHLRLPRRRDAAGAPAAPAEGPRGLTPRGDFAGLQSISIDYGVMEPESQTTRRIALVPGDFGWSDVGSFAALPEVRAVDARGNA